MNKKIKIIIAGAIVCIGLLGVGFYMIFNASSSAGNKINNQLDKGSVSSIQKNNKKNNKDSNNTNEIKEDQNKTESNNKVEPKAMKTNPVLNTQINPNANNNANAETMNYADLFNQMFGYQYKYPQMVSDNQINFLKSLTIYQLSQIKAMVPYTKTTADNKSGMNQYLQQLKQLKSSTTTILSVIANLQSTSKDQEFINQSNKFLSINGTILSALSNEISNIVVFNASYSQLYNLPFGASMNNFVSQLSDFNNTLGPDNNEANTWLKNAQNTFVMYTGPLSKSKEVSTSSSSTITQQ